MSRTIFSDDPKKLNRVISVIDRVVRFVRVTTNNFNLGKREIFRHHTIMQRGSFSHPVDIKGISVFVRETLRATIF